MRLFEFKLVFMIESKRNDFIQKDDYRKNFKRSVDYAESMFHVAELGINGIVSKLKSKEAQLFRGQLKNFQKLLIDFEDELGDEDDEKDGNKEESYCRDFLKRMKQPLVDILAKSKEYFKIPNQGVKVLEKIAKDSADFQRDMLSSKQGISYSQFLHSMIFEFEKENGLLDRERLKTRSNIFSRNCTLLEAFSFIIEKDPTSLSKHSFICLGCWKIIMLSPFKKDKHQNARFKKNHMPLLIPLSSFMKRIEGNSENERMIDIMELIYYLYADKHEFLDKEADEYLYLEENKARLTFMPFPLIFKQKKQRDSDPEYKPGTKQFEHECFNSKQIYQGKVAQSNTNSFRMSWEYLLSPKLIKSPQFSSRWYEEVKERLEYIIESDSSSEEREDGSPSRITQYDHRLRERKKEIRVERSSKYSISQASSKRQHLNRRVNYKIKAIESLSIPLEIRRINLRMRTVRILVHSLNAVYQFDAKTDDFSIYQLSKRQYDHYLNRIEELKGKGKGDENNGEEGEEEGSGEEEDEDDDGMLFLYRR